MSGKDHDQHEVKVLKVARQTHHSPTGWYWRATAVCDGCDWYHVEGEFSKVNGLARNHAALWGGTVTIKERDRDF